MRHTLGDWPPSAHQPYRPHRHSSARWEILGSTCSMLQQNHRSPPHAGARALTQCPAAHPPAQRPPSPPAADCQDASRKMLQIIIEQTQKAWRTCLLCSQAARSRPGGRHRQRSISCGRARSSARCDSPAITSVRAGKMSRQSSRGYAHAHTRTWNL